MNTLVVPFRVLNLPLRQALNTTGAAADFSRLPYRNAQGQSLHSDVPYLSEYITAPPLDHQAHTLAAGLHLHFELPLPWRTALPDGRYPALPNRWLVVKNTAGQAPKKWVIESDYLWHNVAPDDEQPHTTVPMPTQRLQLGDAPYAHLGRCYPYDTWLTTGNQGHYWPQAWGTPLTALGYGNLDFAGHYPDAQGALTFWDGDYRPDQSATYEVWGWYNTRDLAQDAIQQLTADTGQPPLSSLAETLGHPLLDESTAQTPLHHADMLLYHRLAVAADAQANALPSTPMQVAIGQNSWEALSAFLALSANAEGDTSRLERQLLTLSAQWKAGDRTDFEAAALAHFHQQQFKTLPSGKYWRIRLDSSVPQGDQPPAFQQEWQALLQVPAIDDYLHDAAIMIAGLNFLQSHYDARQHDIATRQHQLFADWYKYMIAAHPPFGESRNYPHPDAILQFLQRHGVQPIDALLNATGQYGTALNADQLTVTYQGPSDSLAGQIAQAADEINQHLRLLNAAMRTEIQADSKRYPHLTGATLAYQLESYAAPRYHAPNEPVVLLAGDAVADRSTPLPELRGLPVWDKPDAPADWLPLLEQSIIEIEVQGTRYALRDCLPARSVTAADRIPRFLEWELSYQPLDDPSAHGGYAADFVQQQFALAPTAADWQVRFAERPQNEWRHYRGRTILTDFAAQRLSQLLAQVDVTQLDADLQRRWATLTDALASTPIQTQVLSGFHEALLMRRQTLQLAIHDPLSTAAYRAIIDTIGAYIGDERTSAPAPDFYFNPIRAGRLRLRTVHVVDTFGRSHVVEAPQPAVAHSLRPAAMDLPFGECGLLPRLVQPARWQLRWIAGEDDRIESTTHPSTTPVCGWVVPQFLDQTLALYDALGNWLGSLGVDDETDEVQLIPRPGKSAFLTSNIKNKHLYALTTYLVYQNGAHFRGFLTLLQQALADTDPDNYDQFDALSLMVGRPLALARLSVHLELMGQPALHQDWDALRQDLRRMSDATLERSRHAFDEVQFPYRLGDATRLNDGVVAYWKGGEMAQQIDFEDTLYVHAQHEDLGVPYLATTEKEEAHWAQRLVDPAQLVTVLVDPRAQLHLTSGILPVKSIDLPPIFWRKAIDRMGVQQLVAPVLTPVGRIALPLPDVPQAEWTWLQVQRQRLASWSSQPLVVRESLEAYWQKSGGPALFNLWDTLVEAGWLRLLEDDPQRAHWEVVTDNRDALPAPLDESAVAQALYRVAQRLEMPDDSRWFERLEIREGWTRLRPDDGA